jgi:uncharacterized protein (DUF58 family)
VTGPWRPTIALVRGAAVTGVLMMIAVLFRRPDALVLAAPFAIVTGWSLVTRPQHAPSVSATLSDSTVREGHSTTWFAHVEQSPHDPAIDVAVAAMASAPWLEPTPPSGVVTGGPGLAIDVRATRWGRHELDPVTVTGTSAWGGFRWMDQTDPLVLTGLPLPTVFEANGGVRHSVGLVGLSRSAAAGDGSEFAGIRAFQAGDRIRRINWPRSLRAGSLHVTSTWADQDTHITLDVDAYSDIGVSGGIDGRASSLDLAVRAAGAIAAHHVQRGDRVSLRVFGSIHPRPVPPSTGQHQLRRILEALAQISAGSAVPARAGRVHVSTAGDALVVILSPLVTRVALERAVSMVRRGSTVVVVDTLPLELQADSDGDGGGAIEPDVHDIAWRIRLLERDREIRLAQAAGVPVMPWRGPGSLDPFLHAAVRHAAAPRLARR